MVRISALVRTAQSDHLPALATEIPPRAESMQEGRRQRVLGFVFLINTIF